MNRALAVLLVALMLAACGEPHEYAGYRRTPEPDVTGLELPELVSGETRDLVPANGHLLVVYFGYTYCPDFCPTTMSDLRLARNRLDDPSLIEPAMVTIDPNRDTDVLDEYVGSFFDDGLAFATDDPSALAAVAGPFGVTYSVDDNPAAATDDDADPFTVSHSTSLYAVDDDGELVMTWQFGIPVDDLAADLEALLADQAEEAGS